MSDHLLLTVHTPHHPQSPTLEVICRFSLLLTHCAMGSEAIENLYVAYERRIWIQILALILPSYVIYQGS